MKHGTPRSPEAPAMSEPVRYISYQKAKQILSDRLKATPEEIAVWVWYANFGGIRAFSDNVNWPCCKADDCSAYTRGQCDDLSPPEFHFPDASLAGIDCVPIDFLADCYFLESAVIEFKPGKDFRFITWATLLSRWGNLGLIENEVRRKVSGRISVGEITEHAPIWGGTALGGTTDAPARLAMFQLDQVEALELRDFGERKVGAGEAAPAADSRPGERRDYFRRLWLELNKPAKNDDIWKATHSRSGKNGCPITSTTGNKEFVFQYSDGCTDRLDKSIFQKDMSAVRKG